MSQQNTITSPWKDWEIRERLGGGSFGTVYRMQRRLPGGGIEEAAVKVISIPYDRSEIQEQLNNGSDRNSINQKLRADLQNITKEYRIMEKLKHCPNVVRCDEMKEVARPLEGGFTGWDLFIRMELLKPLDSILPDIIPDALVVQVGLDICRALTHCSRDNIVHRDIKPANILVARDGAIKLTDFGIARTMERTTGATKAGTYHYMAPEVYNGQAYHFQADIYSLGMVLYWLLNNRRGPFLPMPPKAVTAKQNEEAMQRRFRGDKLPEPANGRENLKRIVMKACSFRPEDRFSTPEEMYHELKMVFSNYASGTQPRSESASRQTPPTGAARKTAEPAALDCHASVNLSALEAAMGCQKTVMVDSIPRTVSIPEDIKNGQTVRFRGLGRSDAAGNRGDLYVKINIVIVGQSGSAASGSASAPKTPPTPPRQQPSAATQSAFTQSTATQGRGGGSAAWEQSVGGTRTERTSRTTTPGGGTTGGAAQKKAGPGPLDCRRSINLTALEAATGCRKTITVEGVTHTVAIPEDIKNGQTVRFTGLGRQEPGTGARGDLYLVINIVVASSQPSSGAAPTHQSPPVTHQTTGTGLHESDRKFMRILAWVGYIVLAVITLASGNQDAVMMVVYGLGSTIGGYIFKARGNKIIAGILLGFGYLTLFVEPMEMLGEVPAVICLVLPFLLWFGTPET